MGHFNRNKHRTERFLDIIGHANIEVRDGLMIEEMGTLTITALAMLAIIGILYLLMKLAISRSISKVKKPPVEIKEDMVQCFSCGHVVPAEKALEKKGRYFCGLKKGERGEFKES